MIDNIYTLSFPEYCDYAYLTTMAVHLFLQDTYYESDFEEEDEEDAMLKLPKIVSIPCLSFVATSSKSKQRCCEHV